MDFSKYKDFVTKYIEHITTTLILIPVSILFVIHEFSNDVKIYQGVARLTDYFGIFPINIDLAYETKPIVNRMLNYFLYKISSLFTTFGTPEYEIVIKIISLICVLLICYYFSTKFKDKYIFLLSVLAFLTPLNFITLVPDWWSPLFALLSIGLFLTDKPSNHYLSGIVITIIFLMKGPTIIFVIPIACALYLLKSNDWINCLKRGAISSSLSLIFILLCGYFKNIIPDIILFSKYGHLGQNDIFTMLINFVNMLIPTFFFIPIVIVGLISALFVYYTLVKKINLITLTILGLMWASTFFYVIIQNAFHLYHYMALVIPSIISIILLSNVSIKRSIVIIIIIFTTLSYLSLILNVENSIGNSSIAKNVINNLSDIQYQDHILYLDSGAAPYYFISNTSCRFIQSLPFKTNSDTWNITATPYYQENFKCIIDYQGKYIIMDNNNWLEQNTSDNRQVMFKIQTEYKQVWNDGWNIYERRS